MSAPAASYGIGPLTFYADVPAMRQWMEAASAGNELIYATGPALGDHAAKRLALDWHAAGKVDLFQRRSIKPNCFDYTARRRRAVVAAVPAATSGRATVPLYLLPREELALFELLREIAAAGQPCPSNDELARRLNMKNRRQAQYRFNRLTQLEFIRVIEPARFGARVIEIVPDKCRTAPVPAPGARS